MAFVKECEEAFYVCNVCKKQFKQEKTFQLHRLIHKKEQEFSCDICKEEFQFLSRLQKHCLLKHSNNLLVVGQAPIKMSNKDKFPCNVCDKGFTVLSSLQKHILRVHGSAYLYTEEQSFQSLTITNDSNGSDDIYPMNAFSNVSEPPGSLSVEFCIKQESDISYDESIDPEKMCAVLWDEGPSSDSKRNHAAQDFSKKNLSQVNPDRLSQLSIKKEPDSFDTEEAHYISWSKDTSLHEKGLADSTDGRNIVSTVRKPKAVKKYRTRKRGKGATAQRKRRAKERSLKIQTDENIHESLDMTENALETGGRNIMSLPTVRKPKAGKKERTRKRGKRATAQRTRRAKERSQKIQTGENIHELLDMTENASLETGERDNSENQFSCSICDKKFAWRCHLQNHMRTHEPKTACDQPLSNQPSNALSALNIGQYLCETCNERFVKNEDFQKHFLTHTEQNTHMCKVCNKNFSQRCHLQNHIHTHEPKIANYTPRFTSDQPLSNQPSNALDALNIGPYLCETCHERFVKNEDFQKHCLTHSEQNTHTCKVCNKQFVRHTNFRAHCETHLEKKTFDCNLCGTSFHYQKHLINHQQVQSENGHLKCKFCNEAFENACSLISHEQTHSGYHCKDCDSVFSAADDLKRHQRSHTYESKCGVCGKTFSTNDSESHFGTEIYCCEDIPSSHQDDMPHVCQLCNVGFLHAWSLRNHLLEHEANQDAEMFQNCILEENAENMEILGS